MQSTHAAKGWGNYAGPVARAYELFTAKPVAVMVGPTGGGKSQASARRCLRVALAQHPSPLDGKRKARVVVVCPTYRRAWDTVIPSYLKVFDKGWNTLDGKGGWKGAQGDPVDHTFEMQLPDGKGGAQIVRLEVLFRAVRDESVEEFVRGFETTAWWFPEMDTMPAEDLVSLTTNRVGRFPEPEDRPDPSLGLGETYAGVFGDANAPVIESWFWKRFYQERRPTDALFRQPDAFAPNAENMHNLRKIRPDYYDWLASTMEDYDVGRLLRCRPGYSRFGKPVHEHFDDQRMVAPRKLDVDLTRPVRIGMDSGNTLKSAATFSQRTFTGQKRFLREISPVDRQIDLEEFCAAVRREMDTTFRGVPGAEIIVDPAAKAAMAANRKINYAQLIQAHTGIPVRLAPSNDPGLRRSSVDNLMRRNAGPGEPAVLVCPEGCPRLIEAWSGGYRFRKVGNVYQPQPEKNDHSHEAEAAQYDVLDDQGIGPVGGFMPRQSAVPPSVGVILD